MNHIYSNNKFRKENSFKVYYIIIINNIRYLNHNLNKMLQKLIFMYFTLFI